MEFIIDLFKNIDTRFISDAANVVIAVCACRGLYAWKDQVKAESKSNFLKELIPVADKYERNFILCIDFFHTIEKSISSMTEEVADKTLSLERYIENSGSRDGAVLSDLLAPAEEALIELRVLLIRGDFLKIYNNRKGYRDIYFMLETTFKWLDDVARGLVAANCNSCETNRLSAIEVLTKVLEQGSAEIKAMVEDDVNLLFEHVEDDLGFKR